MLKYLVDTNIISEQTKLTPNQGVVEKLTAHAAEVAIASTTWHELCFGVLRLPASHKRDRLTRFLDQLITDNLVILPYDTAAANWHATERDRLTRIGKPPAFEDSQIAAIAAVNHLTLVTHNESDFQFFQGIQLENWMR